MMKKGAIILLFLIFEGIRLLAQVEAVYPEGGIPLVANAGHDTAFCVYNLDELILGGDPAASGGTPPYTFSWSCEAHVNGHVFNASVFLDDTSSANPSFRDHYDTLRFRLLVTDSNDSSAVDSVTVLFSEFIMCLLECWEMISEGDSIQLHHCIEGGIKPYSYEWIPTGSLLEANVSKPWAKPTTTTTYDLTLTDSAGCVIQSSCHVEVEPDAYEPVLDTNKKWYTHIYEYWTWGINTEVIQIGSGRVVNDTTYSIVLRSTGGDTVPSYHYGLIREDNAKKVYYRSTPDQPEYLMYDFRISEMDTVNVYGLRGITDYNLSGYTYRCDSIRTIEYYQITRSVYYLTPIVGETGQENWIEGIGSTKGLLHHWDGRTGEDGFRLSCVWTQDNILFKASTSEPCVRIEAKIDNEFSDLMQIYPIPFSDQLTIEGLPKESLLFEIYNVQGRLVLQQIERSSGSATMNTTDIRPGLYFLRITTLRSGQTITNRRILRN